MFKRMFRFKGRARRKEYWLATLANLLVDVALYAAMYISFLFAVSDTGENGLWIAPVIAFVYLAYAIVSAIAMLALEIRRLHDTGRAWHAIFVTLIPLVGQYLLIWYMIEDSQIGANEYGPNPKGLE